MSELKAGDKVLVPAIMDEFHDNGNKAIVQIGKHMLVTFKVGDLSRPDKLQRVRDATLNCHEYRDELYELLARDHGITALESELDDIAHVVFKALLDRIAKE